MKFFECFVPIDMQESHRRAGGRGLKMFVANTDDGMELRVMAASEPTKNIWHLHISVSVGRGGLIGSHRAPKDDELNAVIDWAAVKYPGRPVSEQYFGRRDPMIRQLWEIEPDDSHERLASE